MPDANTDNAVELPQVDATQMGGDPATIAAKTEFVKAYAESQRVIIDAKAAADAKRMSLALEDTKATFEGLASLVVNAITTGPMQKLFEAKAAQMTAEQTEASEKRKTEAEAQARRDKDDAETKKRRDYLGAAIVVLLVAGIGALSMMAVYFVSRGVIDAKAMAVVAGNIASAITGLALGRRTTR